MELMIPSELRQLLAPSSVEGNVLRWSGEVATILEDNKTPFFPAYTDHGKRHVERILASAVRLIPRDVWDEGTLGGLDAATMICASLLHDLGLHVREQGFFELVSASTRFEPLPWFRDRQGSRPPDLPWPELWEEFRREARHLSGSALDRILGPRNDGLPAVAVADQIKPDELTEYDRLLIGEFLRRHHARLSHEIAIYGFPGGDDDVMRLRKSLPNLADVMGAVARSHNENMRVCTGYFAYKSPKNRRPSGVVATYLLAVLRIADYLQLDADRAPLVLLRLKAPQSRQSIDEWKKHNAVASISWDHDDPLALFFEISSDHGLRTHLQLRELFADLQQELDSTTAVLSETYSAPPFESLRLSCQRVYSNLDEPSLHSELSYIPARARLRSAEDLFRLVIRDLYGDKPVVAGRELLHNAVDAVRMRERWSAISQRNVPDDSAFLIGDVDVVVEMRSRGGEQMELRIVDRGIGMTPDTVKDYFLVAGGSLRPSPKDEPTDDATNAIRWMKAGRFGVGVFAAFLLGPEVQVRTRHIEAERGVAFRARIDDDLVQLNWLDMPFGTEIVVPFRPARAFGLNDHEVAARFLQSIATTYPLASPSVIYRTEGFPENSRWEGDGDLPVPGGPLPAHWRSLDVPDFDAVLWAVPSMSQRQQRHLSLAAGVGRVTHNGMLIGDPDRHHLDGYRFSHRAAASTVRPPGVAVFDSRHRLGISLTRFRLIEETLKFEPALLRGIGKDITAHSLAAGPSSYPLSEQWGVVPVWSSDGWMPALPGLMSPSFFERLCVAWTSDRGSHGARTSADLSDYFTKTRSSISWDRLPVRMVLPLIKHRGDEAEKERWGFSLHDVASSVWGIVGTWSISPICSVVVRLGETAYLDELAAAEAQLAEEGFQGFDWPQFDEERWVTGGEPSADDVGVYRLAADDDISRTEDEMLLEAAGRQMLMETGHAAIALSMFAADSVAGELIDDPLAESWESTIGGFLSRDPAEREALSADLSKTDTELGVLIENWRRLGEGEHSRLRLFE